MDVMLPLIPHGASEISNNLSVIKENGDWTYFHGCLPVAIHAEDDVIAFRILTAGFINTGRCRNIDIIRVFGVSKSSVIRSVKKYSDGGAKAFLSAKATRGNRTLLTAEKIVEAEDYLSQGFTTSEVADLIGIKYGTLSKAIYDGRVKKLKHVNGLNKSDRSAIDAHAVAGFGVACTRVDERALAAFGMLNIAESRFETCYDVSNGGVLAALPALAVNGLYYKVDEIFEEFDGYYSMIHILTLLGFMALSRIKTVEQLRWQPPGELGKLLGLDRVPEVRCLRKKLSVLSQDDRAQRWAEELSTKWMDDNPDIAGVLYVDGHVRLYDGIEKLPKQYVSRERLCLKGVMDFWVNDMLGSPFFVVRKSINPGMIQTLRDNIVPQLLKDVPNQPSAEALSQNKLLHRFILVFDREGYSPGFFKEMWGKHRIACMTYHKFPKNDWDKKEFRETEVNLVSGETVKMKLAERGSFIGDKKDGVWVKEIRKLTKSGHQTSIITTAYTLTNIIIAAYMFARWCQENFFNYMMQHFAIDLLADYKKLPVSDSDKVVSPTWRKLERAKNSINGKLATRKKRFADFTLHPMVEANTKKYHDWQQTQIDLAEEITLFEAELKEVKSKQKKIQKHIIISELPEDEQFKNLDNSKKNLLDAVKMIAYRTETAMGNIIANECGSLAKARALLRDLFVSEADILPDHENKILMVRFHNLSTSALDKKLDKLIEHLNSAKMKYPGTDMLLKYSRILPAQKGVIPNSSR